jgi:hypothetical protein
LRPKYTIYCSVLPTNNIIFFSQTSGKNYSKSFIFDQALAPFFKTFYLDRPKIINYEYENDVPKTCNGDGNWSKKKD